MIPSDLAATDTSPQPLPLTAEERAKLIAAATSVLACAPGNYDADERADARLMLKWEATVAVLEAELTAALADCRTLTKLASAARGRPEFATLGELVAAQDRRDFYLREDQRLKEMK